MIDFRAVVDCMIRTRCNEENLEWNAVRNSRLVWKILSHEYAAGYGFESI